MKTRECIRTLPARPGSRRSAPVLGRSKSRADSALGNSAGHKIAGNRCARGRTRSGWQYQDPLRTIQRNHGYLLIECLVYILVLFILLGVSYLALFRCISNSVDLRHNAEDISTTLHIGECWRADVHSATGNIRFVETNSVQLLYLPNDRGQTVYCFASNSISRSHNGGPWSQLLTNVASSTMAPDRRKTVTAWYWNLELRTRSNKSRVRPLFTFMSVPETAAPK